MGADLDAPPIERLRTAAAFQRLLRTRPRMISAHFALHHLAAHEDSAVPREERSSGRDLSTGTGGQTVHNVDDSSAWGSPGWAFGVIVPKRHARRAVTRSLMKREMRSAFRRRASRLEPGAWLVRLRSSFDPQRFPSAVSRPLMQAARAELDELLERCVPSPAVHR